MAISSKVEFLVVIVGGVAGFGLNILSLLVFLFVLGLGLKLDCDKKH